MQGNISWITSTYITRGGKKGFRPFGYENITTLSKPPVSLTLSFKERALEKA